MSSHKEVVSNYAQNIWSSIENNLQSIEPEDTAKLSKFVKDINKFYLSLFGEKNGVFDQDAIDNKLKDAPKISETPYRTAVPSVARTSQVVLPRRKGTGKGSPLKPRKVVVSKRQERVRKKRGFDLSDISPAPATPPRTKKTKSSETSSQATQESDSPSEGPSEAESSQDQSQVAQEDPPLLPPEPETTESLPPERDPLLPLRLQVREKCVQAGVKRFQLLISKLQSDGEEVDSQECEQELFSRDIATWKRVPEQLECGLRLFWNEAVSAVNQDSVSDEEKLRWIVRAHNTANGVTNSMAHLVGYVVNAIANDVEEDLTAVLSFFIRGGALFGLATTIKGQTAHNSIFIDHC